MDGQEKSIAYTYTLFITLGSFSSWCGGREPEPPPVPAPPKKPNRPWPCPMSRDSSKFRLCEEFPPLNGSNVLLDSLVVQICLPGFSGSGLHTTEELKLVDLKNPFGPSPPPPELNLISSSCF